VRIKGDIPSPLNPPKGCSFHTRCPLAFDLCRRTEPRLLPGPHGQQVACHLVHGATA
jgi:oligopeptide transport system ATP-binding protein